MALRACCRPAPAFAVPCGDRDPALASSVPRRPRRAATGGPGGLSPALVDGCPEGRADISLRSRAGAETPVVVQDAKVLVAGCKGARRPLLDGSRESRSLPGRDATAITLPSAGTGSMPVSVQRPADQSLGESAPKGRMSPRDSLGGPRGMGNPPARCGAVLPRTPCTLLNGDVPLYSIMEKEP